jgi:hypothetical protein
VPVTTQSDSTCTRSKLPGSKSVTRSSWSSVRCASAALRPGRSGTVIDGSECVDAGVDWPEQPLTATAIKLTAVRAIRVRARVISCNLPPHPNYRSCPNYAGSRRYRGCMPSRLITDRTYVPTVGPVTWVALEEVSSSGVVGATQILSSYGPTGAHLTPAEQDLLITFEPRLPGDRKYVWPTVRFA